VSRISVPDITVRFADDRFEATGRSGRMESGVSLWGRFWDDDYPERFRASLERFIKAVGDTLDAPASDRVGRELRALVGLSDEPMFNLFGRETGNVLSLFHTEMDACSLARRVPIVKVIAPAHSMPPIEFLPVFGREATPPPVRNRQDLEKLMCWFLGHQAIVWREPREMNAGIPQSHEIRINGKLPLKFYRHSDLMGSNLEYDFFSINDHFIDLDGPWPNQSTKDARSELSRSLWLHPAYRFDGNTPIGMREQIYHFACHCSTVEPKTSQHSMIFKSDSGIEWKVSQSEMMQEAARTARSSLGDSRSITPGLIFLNACGTSRIAPQGAFSFPLLFLTAGHRGCIGSAANIPDQFAAAFSQQFYWYLFRGMPVGTAMYWTRRKMLRQHSNPLGFLYVLHADPSLVVSPKARGVRIEKAEKRSPKRGILARLLDALGSPRRVTHGLPH
jgi:hypothetical protein